MEYGTNIIYGETGTEKELFAQEIDKIEKALAASGGNRGRTAELLGISTATLWRKMKKYGTAD